MNQKKWVQRLSFLLFLGAGCLAWLGVQGMQDAETALSGGLDGLVENGAEQAGRVPADEGRVYRNAEGVEVPWGTKDELGYALPLDIKRPRPKRADRPSLSIEEITQHRMAWKSAFPETVVGPNDGHTHNETSIAINGNTLIAGWNQFNGSSSLIMGVGRSADRGQTWSTSTLVTGTAMSDPVVKSGGGNRWYFAYIAGGGPGGNDYDVYVQRSDDDGLTWQSPVSATGNNSFDDKPYIAASGDEVLVAWADFGFSPARVSATRSLDGGLTWNADQLVSVDGGNGALPIIAPNGDYFVFWRGSFQQNIWMVKSTDQGANWTAPSAVGPMSPLPTPLPNASYRIVNLPTAAVDPLTGDLVVLWNDQYFGNPDIIAVRSSDGGNTWSTPVKVNDDTGTEAQFFPWVTTDENGTIYAVWYDRRHNGVDLDVYMSSSTDGGATWDANTRITGSSFTPVLPWEGGAADFIGDYNAVAADSNDVFPFYQDSRSGIQDVYVSVVPVGGGGPTPVNVTLTSIAAEDGWVRESSETSNVGGTARATGSGSRPIRPGDASSDRQYKAIVSFDTSAIPAGATIQSATLRLRRGTTRGSDPFTSGFGDCRVDVMSGGFSGSTALQASDFEAVATASVATTLSAPAANGDWSEGTLNAAGLAAINTSGTTQLRIYFALDDNDDGGEDIMGYYSGDNSTAANRPQLVVTYLP